MKKFTSLLLASCVLLPVSSSFAQGVGEPELSFYPSTSWQVSSAGECRVGAEFNNGFIVDFTGGANGFDAVEVNFRQDVFDEDRSYPVNFYVPGIQSYERTGSVVNAEKLRVPVQSKGFLDVTSNASVLDMEVEGNNFRFYMIGFKDAAKAFSNCINAKIAGNASSSMQSGSPMGGDPSYAEPVSYKNVEPSVLGRMSAYEEDIVVSTSSTIAEQPAPAQPMSSQVAATQTVTATNAASDLPTLQPIRNRAQIATGGASVSDASAADVNVSMPVQTMPALAPEPMYAPESAVLPDVAPAANESAENIVMLGEPEVSNSAENLEYLGIESDTTVPITRESYKVRADFASDSRIAELQAENAALRQELEMALVEARSEDVMIASDNWDLERATMRYNEAELQIKTLGQKLQRERSQCDLEKRELEAMLFDPQVTNQAQLAQLSALEEKLARNELELERQRMQYEERIRVLQSQ